VPNGILRFWSGKGSKLCVLHSVTVKGLCRTNQCNIFASWQIPPPIPGLALPIESSIPSLNPRLRVGLPMSLQNEKESPGWITKPLSIGTQMPRLCTLLCCSHISLLPNFLSKRLLCFFTLHSSLSLLSPSETKVSLLKLYFNILRARIAYCGGINERVFVANWHICVCEFKNTGKFRKLFQK